jgi:Rieske Fe-S protein
MIPERSLESPSRRSFCSMLGALAAASALRGAVQIPGAPERPQDPEPLKLTGVTRGEMVPGKVVDYRKLGFFFLMADDKGVYALSAICTHLGCTVHTDGDTGFSCPCHDSGYDRDGEVTQGPAKRHLAHLAVRETGPQEPLQVDVSTIVPPEARL